MNARRTHLAVLSALFGCGVEVDLAPERFSCGRGGPCAEDTAPGQPPEAPDVLPDPEDGVDTTCPTVQGRWIALDPRASPNRARHTAILSGTTMFVFGGEGRYNDDTWTVDLTTSTLEFENLEGETAPEGRDEPALVPDPAGRRAYLYGGTAGGAARPQLWALSLETNTWTELPVEGAPPRFAHAAIFDQERSELLVLFGEDHFDRFDDVWSFSPANGRWTELALAGVRPPARSDHAAVAMGADRVVVIGGRGAAGPLDDTWLLDRDTATWSRLALGPGPGALAGHTAVALEEGRRVLVFGGMRGDGSLSAAAWVLDLALECWAEVRFAAGPAPPARAQHAMVLYGRSAIIYGGENLEAFDDLWALDLE